MVFAFGARFWTSAESGKHDAICPGNRRPTQTWEMRNVRDNGLIAAGEETDGSRRLDQGGG